MAVIRLKIRRLREFLRSHSGNVAIIFALSALPMIGMIGYAIDYSYMLAIKSKLDQAADAAAVAGSTTAQAYIVANTTTNDVTAQATAAGQVQATAQFNANVGRIPPGTLVTPTPAVARNNQTITTTVNYTMTMTPWLMKALGVNQMTVSGTSVSSVTMPTYVNVYVVIDNSESMGIGSTSADQSIVYSKAGNCAVACHYSGTEATAHSAGAVLRIDVAKQAVIAGLNNIPSGGNYKVAIYTMSNSLVNVFALSNNITAAETAVNSIDLANDSYDGGTDTTYALTKLANLLPAAGAGLTSSTAQGVVMLITDAVQDSLEKVGTGSNATDSTDPNFTVFSPCNQSSCEYDSDFKVYFESFDPKWCTPIKNANYTMMTLDVQYLIPSLSMQGGNTAFQNAFAYIQNYLLQSIPANMTSCATSSAYAFSANTPSQIAAATNAMFQAIPLASQNRLTQ